MAFFRVKKIKGKEYAYIVENEWKANTSRQKVKSYLGRAYGFEMKRNIEFQQFTKAGSIKEYIEDNDGNKIINDLVELELFKFNINKNDFLIDLINRKVQKKGRNIALLINDGLLCETTLRNLLEFRPVDEQTDTYRFARAFVEAGIRVPQEIFVGLFGKLHKPAEKPKSDFTW